MFELKFPTPQNWVQVALSDFNTFLVDHAACERKASAVGMSFVVRYPDRKALLDPMIQFAREELEHFHQVVRLVSERGLLLAPDAVDGYVNRLQSEVRFGREERFLDRLLTAAVIEARGFERLQLVCEALEEAPLKTFYSRLARAEGHHRDLFVGLAFEFFDSNKVTRRLDQLLEIEAVAIQSVPFRPALH